MPLLNLAKKVHDTFGLQHQTHLGVLRHYIKTTSEEKLVEEISTFTDAALLRVLWEAGLSQACQDMVLMRLNVIS